MDAGQFELRLRAPAGTRIEATEAVARTALDVIGQRGRAGERRDQRRVRRRADSAYPINTIHLWSSGPEEAVLQVQLKRSARSADRGAERAAAPHAAPSALPGVRFSFEPGDIVSRVMSFGSPTPVEVAVSGPDFADDRPTPRSVRGELAAVPSLRDLQFEQELDYPAIKVELDRERAGAMGVTAEQVARSLAAGDQLQPLHRPELLGRPQERRRLPGAGADPDPADELDRVEDRGTDRRSTGAGGGGQVPAPADVAGRRPTAPCSGEYDRYNMQRMLTLAANVAGEDLGRRRGPRGRRHPPGRRPAGEGDASPSAGRSRRCRNCFGGLQMGLAMAVARHLPAAGGELPVAPAVAGGHPRRCRRWSRGSRSRCG